MRSNKLALKILAEWNKKTENEKTAKLTVSTPKIFESLTYKETDRKALLARYYPSK